MAAPRPRLFTIPPSAPFLPTLIAALLDGRLTNGVALARDPLALARATIYLPTRRACRLAHDLFLDALGGEAALLPRLSPIGDVDEDELIFAEAAGPLAATALELPPALGGLERRLLLAQLILKWTQSADLGGTGSTPMVANTPVAALGLADALARLADDMITRGVPWSKLDTLAPDHFDAYWQRTLEFLKIAREGWPALLAAHGAMEPAERRDRLIAAEAERLKAGNAGPVIAAGSTASMPATALLLGTIARLPHGAVVLPGLDPHLDEPSWKMIAGAGEGEGEKFANAASHPQFSMHGFLVGLGVNRDDVEPLTPAAPRGRERLLSEALRPAAATDLWPERLRGRGIEQALDGVTVIVAANAEEEALAVALALREAVETPGRTAALITPDRALARRAIAALARWNVTVDDSGGGALADTPAGVFARLSAEAALGGLEPVTLLALLKHPLLRLGAEEGAHARSVATLERAVLRGPRPSAGTRGLVRALEALETNRDALHPGDPRRRLRDRDIAGARGLAGRLQGALAPLEGLASARQPLSELARRHRETLLLLTDNGDGGSVEQDDGAAVLQVLDDIAASAAAASFAVTATEYAEVVQAAMAAQVVRRPPLAQPQVRVFGLLEARLQHMDRVVLGGLVEGTWPPQTRSDPWLSRPMRHALGLDLPERRIGLTAHDFAQAMGGTDVFLTSAGKIAGAPTVPSRFLHRLAAVAGEARWNAARARGESYLAMARSLDRPARVEPVKPPSPKPPISARPTRLSVTEIEHWLRDPYTIYAKHILRLRPLDPVDTPLGARDRGSVIHAAIEDFTKAYADRLPDDPLGELLAFGRRRFAPIMEFPEAQAFWWPRFERIAAWFAQWEAARRAGLAALHVEVDGELDIPAPGTTFKLTVRADRIEVHADGRYGIFDYKTGKSPTDPQVMIGLAPQLTLEGAILRRGGFAGIPTGGSVAELSYVELRGGDPPGEPRTIRFKGSNADAEADKAYARLCDVVARFAGTEQAYHSLALSMWRSRYGDYDHLARVKEWSIGETEEGNGG